MIAYISGGRRVGGAHRAERIFGRKEA